MSRVRERLRRPVLARRELAAATVGERLRERLPLRSDSESVLELSPPPRPRCMMVGEEKRTARECEADAADAPAASSVKLQQLQLQQLAEGGW